ncbi:MAG: hypothetical protein KAW14_14715, partial [Candidatus Aegiribacteria sp.]|nr:hypothetical protein [Candidatus Aegiribacteria sp.]
FVKLISLKSHHGTLSVRNSERLIIWIPFSKENTAEILEPFSLSRVKVCIYPANIKRIHYGGVPSDR